MVELRTVALALVNSFESRFWFRTAILSRLLITILIVFSDYLITDHFPGDDVTVFPINRDFIPKMGNFFVQNVLASFTKWDSAYYLTIARDGMYTNEQQFAFFPLYSSLVHTLAITMNGLLLAFHDLCSYAPEYFTAAHFAQHNIAMLFLDEDLGGIYILSALIISNVAFILSVGILRSFLQSIIANNSFLYCFDVTDEDYLSNQINKLCNKDAFQAGTLYNFDIDMQEKEAQPILHEDLFHPHNDTTNLKIIKKLNSYRKKKLLDYAVLIYICNPASIFFSSVYTESLYAFFTFSGLLILDLLWNLDNNRKNILHNNKSLINIFFYLMRNSQIVILHIFPLLIASYSLFLASSTRSNGILNGIIVVFFLLNQIINNTYYDTYNTKNFVNDKKNTIENAESILLKKHDDDNNNNDNNNDIKNKNENINKYLSTEIRRKLKMRTENVNFSDETTKKESKKNEIRFLQRKIRWFFSALMIPFSCVFLVLSTTSPYFIANENIKNLVCKKCIDSPRFDFFQKYFLPSDFDWATSVFGFILLPKVNLYERSLNGPLGRTNDESDKRNSTERKSKEFIKYVNKHENENRQEDEIVSEYENENDSGKLDFSDTKHGKDIELFPDKLEGSNVMNQEEHGNPSISACCYRCCRSNRKYDRSDNNIKVSYNGISNKDSNNDNDNNNDNRYNDSNNNDNINNDNINDDYINNDNNNNNNDNDNSDDNNNDNRNKDNDIDTEGFSLFPSISCYCDMYSLIQKQYWNVGFLKYYTVKQIPNFILAAPIIFISFFTIYNITMQLIKKKFDQNVIDLRKKNDFFSSSQDGVRNFFHFVKNIFVNSLSAHVTHLFFVTSLGLLVAHVQIVTRLICSSCPIIYIGLGTLLLNKTEKININIRKEKYEILELNVILDPGISKIKEKLNFSSLLNLRFFINVKLLVISYVLLYIFLGILLHPNFYPWT